MRKFKLYLLFLLVVSVIFTSCSKMPMASSKEPDANLKVNSEKLKETEITSYINKDITKGKNILYCSSFQMVWNELSDNIIKDEIKFKDSPEMLKKLNERIGSKDDLSPESYVVMSGFGRDNIIEKINKELKEKFKDDAPTVKEELKPDDLLSYAYLYKNIDFKIPFEKLDGKLNFNGEKVKAFGLITENKNSDEIAKQVIVEDYKNNDDFIISIENNSEKDEIILAKVPDKGSLLTTANDILNRCNLSSKEKMNSDEDLMIPKFDFDIVHSYDELVKKEFLNEGFEDYFISKAIQDTRFKLYEKGVVLKSEAKITCEKGCASERKFIFNKPFMIIMREKGAKSPYFVLWVENTELMVK